MVRTSPYVLIHSGGPGKHLDKSISYDLNIKLSWGLKAHKPLLQSLPQIKISRTYEVLPFSMLFQQFFGEKELITKFASKASEIFG